MIDSVQHPVVTTNEKSTQTDRAHCPQTVQASTKTKPPARNYEEELKAQVAITKEAKKCHIEAIAQLGELWEQAARWEADLKHLLDETMTKLQAKEREVLQLQVANTKVKERLINQEERRMQKELQQFEENEELRIRTGSYKRWHTSTFICGKTMKSNERDYLIPITTSKSSPSSTSNDNGTF